MSAPLTLHTFPRAILHIDGDAFFASCEQSAVPRCRAVLWSPAKSAALRPP